MNYQKISCWKDIGIRKVEFKAKTKTSKKFFNIHRTKGKISNIIALKGKFPIFIALKGKFQISSL